MEAKLLTTHALFPGVMLAALQSLQLGVKFKRVAVQFYGLFFIFIDLDV